MPRSGDRSDRRAARLIAAAFVVVMSLSADAFARAGGGDNFGGGGGGGGGGGWGGGGGGWGGGSSFRGSRGGGGGGDEFFVALFVALLVMVLVLVVTRIVEAKQSAAGEFGRGARAAAQAREAGVVMQLQSRDPAFDRDEFVGRACTAFVTAQKAWCAHDLTPIRPFVSDGVFERFSMQLEEQRALGYRDRMEGLRVESSFLAEAAFEGGYEALTLRIAATAADHRIAIATGERVGGSGVTERFAEFWTFLRRRGTKTRAGRRGLLEGNCPNCGDALAGNQFADCPSCKAHLRNGEHDWVLVEITQSGEWAAREHAKIPGVGRLRATDPQFSVTALEDRASVAFWRWAKAMRTGDARVLAGVASEAVVRAAAAEARGSGGAREFVGECGVGSVELAGVVREGDVHRAVVEIRWSGTEFAAAGAGAPRRMQRTGIRTWILEFERSAAAPTAVARDFSSAHCAGCGAPAEGTSATCAYCSAALADVNLAWTLARRSTPFDAAGRMALASVRATADDEEPAFDRTVADAPRVSSSAVLAWAARVAACDGVVDPRERTSLATLAHRAEVADADLDAIVRDALAPGGEPRLPRSHEEAREWLDLAVRQALCDGAVSEDESRLLLRLGAQAGLAPADVRIAVNRTRAEMHHEAREALRRATA